MSSQTTDPYELKKKDLPKADIIITSHEHFDHCNPDSINRISTSSTVLIGPKICQNKLINEIKRKENVLELNPGDSMSCKGIEFKAIPAYNIKRFRSPGNPFHPKESGHIGTILTINGLSIYHAGDTDKIPEMDDIEVNIALLPVSGTYVMDVPECAELADTLKTDIIIPMHVGRGIGKIEYTEELKKLLPNKHVEILKIE